MSTHFYSFAHGTSGLLVTYLLVLIGEMVALKRARADQHKYLLGLLWAFPLLLVVAVCTAILGALLHGSVQIIASSFVSLIVGFAGGHALAVRRSAREPEHRRGAFISSEPVIESRHKITAGPIVFAGAPVPPVDESKHFKIIGTTGTGKSTAIRQILSAALERGDRAIIADPDGGYMNRYYDPKRGDVILNPFNPNAHKWDLFAEITDDFDIEELARSLVPDPNDDDRIWTGYARTLFSQIVRQMRSSNKVNEKLLARLVNRAGDSELRMMLEDTAAARFFKEGNEKMLGSTQGVLASAMEMYKYIAEQSGAPLSVRKWVREGRSVLNGGRGGVLFIPYKAGEIAALRPLISAWMRLGIFEAMNCEEGDQRLWFIIDELDALGKIDGLKDALARLRKFGGRCVLGFQSIAQVSGVHGRSDAETIVENCGNTLILRCSASERGGTSEFASKLIGQREVIHTTMSTTRRSGEWRSSSSKSEQIRIEPAVLASEIERLPDFTGYLKIASLPDWRITKLAVPLEITSPRTREPQARAAPPLPAVASSEESLLRMAEGAEPLSPKRRGRPKGASKSPRRSTTAASAGEIGNDGVVGLARSDSAIADIEDSNPRDPG